MVSDSLARKITFPDAVAIGLSAMIGAGIFSALAPASAAAGNFLIVGLLLAAVVAYLNATATAQLATQYPRSGGVYFFGRQQLGPIPGFIAGWMFITGKTSSSAAMALTFAHYLAPEGWEKTLAVLLVLGLGLANDRGIATTARISRFSVIFVIAVLLLLVTTNFFNSAPERTLSSTSVEPTWYSIAQSAGLLFFAFAGYARLATLGEEVTNPRQTIRRAITVSLGIATLLYLLVAVTALRTLGPGGLSQTTAPLIELAEGRWVHLVQVAAIVASGSALLALLAGISRTVLAMARESDLPNGLTAIHPIRRVPYRADQLVVAGVIVLVLFNDVTTAIGFSSFGILLYYFIANIAAWRQKGEHRQSPRFLQVLGSALCLALITTLPPFSILTGSGVLVFGLMIYWFRHRGSDHTGPPQKDG